MTPEELDKLKQELEEQKIEIEKNVKRFNVGFLIAILIAIILTLLLVFGCTTPKEDYKFKVIKAVKKDNYQVVTFANSITYYTLILPPDPEYKEGQTLDVK